MSIALSEPIYMGSDNQYLDHYSSNMTEQGNNQVASIRFTLFRYLEMEKDKVPIRWICKPGAYLYHGYDSLIEHCSPYAQIPYLLRESTDQSCGVCAVVDQVCTSPDYLRQGYEKSAILLFSSLCLYEVDFITLNASAPPDRFSSGVSGSQLRAFASVGFFFLTDNVAFYAGTARSEDLDDGFIESIRRLKS